MDASTIKAALTIVHLKERSSSNPHGMTRVQAVEDVLRTGPKLTAQEIDVLLRALHVSRSEVSYVPQS